MFVYIILALLYLESHARINYIISYFLYDYVIPIASTLVTNTNIAYYDMFTVNILGKNPQNAN